jgi:hypothetical protein
VRLRLNNWHVLSRTNHGLLITFLLEAGIPVYPVNPKVANQLRKAAGARARSHRCPFAGQEGSL